MVKALIAVDWGTTNRRLYRIEDGRVTDTARDALGVTAMAKQGVDYTAEVTAMRGRFGDLPVLMAGMVGSTIGWQEAPYLPLPATLDGLAKGLLAIDPRTAIVPGLALRHKTRCDVMRGEEVQLLGALIAGSVPADALLCQPGTHCKWALLRGGAVADFTTALTGELFALLREHSVLAGQLQGAVVAGEAFGVGVLRGAKGDLAAALFGVRAAGVLGELAGDDAASFASGILIGADVAARLADHSGKTVYVLADPQLGTLYRTAIEALGGQAVTLDSEAAFLSGITAIGDLWL